MGFGKLSPFEPLCVVKIDCCLGSQHYHGLLGDCHCSWEGFLLRQQLFVLVAAVADPGKGGWTMGPGC